MDEERPFTFQNSPKPRIIRTAVASSQENDTSHAARAGSQSARLYRRTPQQMPSSSDNHSLGSISHSYDTRQDKGRYTSTRMSALDYRRSNVGRIPLHDHPTHSNKDEEEAEHALAVDSHDPAIPGQTSFSMPHDILQYQDGLSGTLYDVVYGARPSSSVYPPLPDNSHNR
ncbi:hypothetical protein CBS101457_000276 [Exobasidium rhododendri]|nr:hypothetical protein CBS101457_000276 [Exobasidium rhododendri]